MHIVEVEEESEFCRCRSCSGIFRAADVATAEVLPSYREILCGKKVDGAYSHVFESTFKISSLCHSIICHEIGVIIGMKE